MSILRPDTPATLAIERQDHVIAVDSKWPWWRKMLAYAGPGYLVAVGYMDPGNWATDVAGGSAFGYSLLSVIAASNLVAILLQFLAAKLGIVTGKDLAEACRDYFSSWVTFFLWIVCEIAIIACDVAEVIGSAIALQLLFNIPLLWGVCLTAADVFVLMYLHAWGIRLIEAFVIVLMAIIAGCFLIEIVFAAPVWSHIISGFIPHREIITNSEMLYLALGIIGATVMPHNLYLHSALVKTRSNQATHKSEIIRFVTYDLMIALTIAFFINAAILIMAASIFHTHGYTQVTDIEEAYKLLTPLLNKPLASLLFALALLASGQNSTLTGTLAGQIVMEGFVCITLKPWLRRLISRGLALLPAIVCVIIYGNQGIGQLLIMSQVVLSAQLAFAVVPLIMFTSSKKIMGEFVNGFWIKCCSWSCALLIIAVNSKYVFDFLKNII